MADLRIETLVTGSFVENGYVVVAKGRTDAVVIDPGAEPERWLDWFTREGLEVGAILLTHGHLDHVGAVAALQEAFGAPCFLHADEREMVAHLDVQCRMFGHPPIAQPKDLRPLADGDVLEEWGFRIDVYATPGHTPGGASYYVPAAKTVFTGDTLFAGTIGRSDLPGGDGERLIRSLKELCTKLDDEVIVCPGHGPETTIGIERRENPFFRVTR